MLILSISSADTMPIAQEIASCSIKERHFSLCFEDSFFESSRWGITVSEDKMTAAAKTGPAKQPVQPRHTQPLVRWCKANDDYWTW